MQNDGLIDSIFQRFREYGNAAYIGEPVSVAEHMLQTARAAEEDGAPKSLIASALLHDFGHLLHDLPEDAAHQGVDTRHEELAFEYLSQYFGDEVVMPIRLHVAAKRYLCAVEPAYLASLSSASLLSLELQGGPFTPEEVDEFKRSRHAEHAIRLRRYDDVAKYVGAATHDIEEYRALLEHVRRTSPGENRY